jgi:hypothetical protein
MVIMPEKLNLLMVVIGLLKARSDDEVCVQIPIFILEDWISCIKVLQI